MRQAHYQTPTLGSVPINVYFKVLICNCNSGRIDVQYMNCLIDYPERKCFDTETSREYVGTWNLTSSGIVCRQWTLQDEYDQSYFPDSTLEEAQNYCRDPDNSGYLWCYTVDDSVSWEFCDLSKCK